MQLLLYVIVDNYGVICYHNRSVTILNIIMIIKQIQCH